MPRRKREDERIEFSAYRTVWLFALYDLPVKTVEDKRQYQQLRNGLLRGGFSMLQYSVYARFFPSEEASEVHRNRIKATLPPKGQVRLLTVTDRQFGKMEVFFGKKREPTEEPPPQLMLF